MPTVPSIQTFQAHHSMSASCYARVLALLAFAMAIVTFSPNAVIGQEIVVAQAAGKASAQGGDASLQKRVQQLEEQLVDMQVTIGTLESLARSGGGGNAAISTGNSFGSGDAARLEGMETQLRALSSEVERLSQQLRRINGGGDRGDLGGYGGSRFAEAPPQQAAPAPPRTTSFTSSFGSTTVTAGGDPIGSLIDGGSATPPAATGQETMVAALPPASSNASAKQEYETAYGHLLRQDYGAAQSAFEDFLQAYPDDQLAGNAQYWLGETHFVRGEYKPAASAFLKGYQKYGRSNKAPDSLLKLAMSLDRLGQKDAACSSFGELVTRFPSAPEHVKSKASTEQRRLKCR